jgi:hypothetical protein
VYYRQNYSPPAKNLPKKVPPNGVIEMLCFPCSLIPRDGNPEYKCVTALTALSTARNVKNGF